MSWTLIIGCFVILIFYLWHYSKYARSDPDRLQSEEYRYEMKKIHMIAAKELPEPRPVDSLNLDKPMFNPEQENADEFITSGEKI